LHTGWEDADALSEEEGENFLEFKVGEGIPAIKVFFSEGTTCYSMTLKQNKNHENLFFEIDT
jgi:hypothetical protein